MIHSRAEWLWNCPQMDYHREWLPQLWRSHPWNCAHHWQPNISVIEHWSHRHFNRYTDPGFLDLQLFQSLAMMTKRDSTCPVCGWVRDLIVALTTDFSIGHLSIVMVVPMTFGVSMVSVFIRFVGGCSPSWSCIKCNQLQFWCNR